MKIEMIKKLLTYMPTDCYMTWVFRKEPFVHGVGLTDAISDFAKDRNMELVQVNLSQCDDFFLHELNEMIAFRKSKPFVCMFDFTDGCSAELKSHLLQLLIHRQHNGFEIPLNVKIVIYDNKVEQDEYDKNMFDMAMMDKCLFYTVED